MAGSLLVTTRLVRVIFSLSTRGILFVDQTQRSDVGRCRLTLGSKGAPKNVLALVTQLCSPAFTAFAHAAQSGLIVTEEVPIATVLAVGDPAQI